MAKTLNYNMHGGETRLTDPDTGRQVGVIRYVVGDPEGRRFELAMGPYWQVGRFRDMEAAKYRALSEFIEHGPDGLMMNQTAQDGSRKGAQPTHLAIWSFREYEAGATALAFDHEPTFDEAIAAFKAKTGNRVDLEDEDPFSMETLDIETIEWAPKVDPGTKPDEDAEPSGSMA